MQETQNAVLYRLAPTPDDDGGDKVGLMLDEAALRLLLDDTVDGARTVTATVVDDREAGSVAPAYAVLEVARRWYGPVQILARTDDDGFVPLPEDGVVRLRVAGGLHVPSRLRGGVEQQ